jgi:hypothetical protein
LPPVASSFEELDKLSSHELRQRAIKHAEHRLDLKFLWNLLEMIPAAQEAEGAPDKLSADVESTRLWLEEYLHPDPALEEALRPVFIDYLQKHGG